MGKINLLIFSPHPDDAILSSSGLIYKNIKENKKVLIVYMTNGDGYEYAKSLWEKKNNKKISMVGFGNLRKKESEEAIKEFQSDNIKQLWLGYPDGFLTQIWNNNSNIKSLHTLTSTNPYTFSYSYKKKYNRKNLKKDIKNILEKYQPEKILVPHILDSHPDHKMTNIIVSEVLKKIKNKNLKNHLEFYLIHYRYPKSGYDNEIDWISKNGKPTNIFYSPKEIKENFYKINFKEINFSKKIKKKILDHYQSQLDADKDFLRFFIKDDEIFWRKN